MLVSASAYYNLKKIYSLRVQPLVGWYFLHTGAFLSESVATLTSEVTGIVEIAKDRAKTIDANLVITFMVCSL
jgi:hypothetical protein